MFEEASAGDPDAAKRRIDAIRSLRIIETNQEVSDLAQEIQRKLRILLEHDSMHFIWLYQLYIALIMSYHEILST